MIASEISGIERKQASTICASRLHRIAIAIVLHFTLSSPFFVPQPVACWPIANDRVAAFCALFVRAEQAFFSEVVVSVEFAANGDQTSRGLYYSVSQALHGGVEIPPANGHK